MSALILDSEAFSMLAHARSGNRPGATHAALQAAVASGADVVVPAAVLAEQYRGGGWDKAVDACLGVHTGILVADTTRTLAREVGHVLARARRGSEDHVDATVVAVAALQGGQAVILTGDPADLVALSEGSAGVAVEAL